MDNIEEVDFTIFIGIHVAIFLINTIRALQAIELCKECLILLLNNTPRFEEEAFAEIYCAIYWLMCGAHVGIYDLTNAERYAKELVFMFHNSSDINTEGKLTIFLAAIYSNQGRYVEAKELTERVIEIMKANGDRQGEALATKKLGDLFHSLGECQKAKEYNEKTLLICKEIGDRQQEADCYSHIGHVFIQLRKYREADEYFQKARRIWEEIGGRKEEERDYNNQQHLHSSLGDDKKAKEYLEKRLPIILELGDRIGEVNVYNTLGRWSLMSHEFSEAEKYLEKAHLLSSHSEDNGLKLWTLQLLTMSKLLQSKIQEANSHISQCIEIFERMRNFNDDQFKISLLEVEGPYKRLSKLLSHTGKYAAALQVEELGRARALADLMAAQYSVENHISADPRTLVSGIEKIIENERNCTCLYLSYDDEYVFKWVIKTSGDIYFGCDIVKEDILRAESVVDLDGLFNKSFRSFGILPRENCEDRSLDDTVPISLHDDSRAPLRGNETKDTERLSLCYKLIVAPAAELLTEPEVIIVPDRSMYRVPFAALRDETGEKYLSENFRIRVVPSLTTLKLIQDSPADYHSQTGALIVGDPKVGKVLFKGRLKNFDNDPLPCARKEAEMVGRLLGVRPLLGEHATKQAVLQAINSVSLIHFAAHGNVERGEIALSPNRATDSTPQEEDYLLTMSDISQVQLRAKLVVLSCCHSGRGQTKKEGVIGIARAFLGSGARSVLVALWALDDTATEQLMIRFYEHLVGGESASESLHEAMKWMRNNGFTKVSEWAPFILIGDNVTFDFMDKGTFIPEKVFRTTDIL